MLSPNSAVKAEQLGYTTARDKIPMTKKIRPIVLMLVPFVDLIDGREAQEQGVSQ